MEGGRILIACVRANVRAYCKRSFPHFLLPLLIGAISREPFGTIGSVSRRVSHGQITREPFCFDRVSLVFTAIVVVCDFVLARARKRSEPRILLSFHMRASIDFV